MKIKSRDSILSILRRPLFLSLIFLFALFLISALIRIDQFQNQPQGRGFYNTNYSIWTNTEVNYHVMSVLKIYEDYPISQHYFASYIPTNGRYESLANSYAVNEKQQELIVYPSFSPAVFIAPYLAFKLFHLDFSYSNLQLFGLAMHLITALLFFFVVRAFVSKKYSANFIAVLAASVYIFSTSALNDHMNVWWAHQLMQPVYLYMLLRFIQTKGALRPWELFMHSLLLILINWTGLFVMLGVSSYYVIRLLKNRRRSDFYPIVAICAGGVLAVSLIVLHVIFVANIDLSTYVGKILTRVDSRSASVDYIPLASLILNNVSNIIIDFGIYLIGCIGLLFYLYKKRYFSKENDKFRWTVIAISSVPILESALLIEHDTVYGFGRLKLLVPFILLLSLFMSILLQFVKNKSRRIAKVSLIAAFAICACVHIFLYLDIYGNGLSNENNYNNYLPALTEPMIPR
jgi:hypothetical protein